MFKDINDSVIISLSKSKKLAKEISEITNIRLVEPNTTKFADGEFLLSIQEPIRELNVFIIQSTSKPVNDSIMELLITIDAVRRASAKTINVIMPYYGYSRQDRRVGGREPITSRLIADLLEKAGATRVLTIDIHSQQQQGFFTIPFDSLTAIWLMLDYLFNNNKVTKEDLVVVSPDYGSVKRTRSIANKINSGFAIIDKNRVGKNRVESLDILGDVANKNCLIFDDIIDTGGTILEACKILKEKGAKNIDIVVTHGLLNKDAIPNFIQAKKDRIINKIYITDTIERKEELSDVFSVISIASLISSAILVFAKGTNCISTVYEKYSFFKFFE